MQRVNGSSRRTSVWRKVRPASTGSNRDCIGSFMPWRRRGSPMSSTTCQRASRSTISTSPRPMAHAYAWTEDQRPSLPTWSSAIVSAPAAVLRDGRPCPMSSTLAPKCLKNYKVSSFVVILECISDNVYDDVTSFCWSSCGLSGKRFTIGTIVGILRMGWLFSYYS